MMLSDQTFRPAPLIAVGPELFHHAACRPQGIDMRAVALFCEQVQVTACFKAYFLALEVTPQIGSSFAFMSALQNLGVTFAGVSICNPHSTASITSCKLIANRSDILYSPNFSDKVLLNAKSLASFPKPIVLAAIKEASLPEAEATYSSTTIYNRTLKLWLTGS